MEGSIFGNAQEQFVSANFQVPLDEDDIVLCFIQNWATHIFLVSLCFVIKKEKVVR